MFLKNLLFLQKLFLHTPDKVENFGGNLGLAALVVLEGKFLEDILRIVGGRLHRDGPGGVLGGGGIQQDRVNP